MGLRDSILGLIPGDAANKVSAAMNNATAGTTSGLDKAMQAHADEKHPVSPPQFYPKPKSNPNPP